MLFDIIKRLSEDTGIHLTQQRDALVNIVHRAAEMIYNRLECNAIMREVTVLVPENMVISLPSFIGPLRGLKESSIDTNVPLYPMMFPRYMKNDWQYKWKNWIEMPPSPIFQNLNAIAPITFEVAQVEGTGITVKVSGQTPNANRLEEVLLLNSVLKATTNSFGPRIDSIVSFDERQFDITVKDDDGNIIALLYNNQNKTHYKLINVAQYTWSKDVADGTTTMEILYKHPYWKMINDSDEFPAFDYENAIYFLSMSLWAAPQQGKEALAATYFQQSMLEPQATKGSEEQLQQKTIQMGRNPLYNAIRRKYYNISFFDTRNR